MSSSDISSPNFAFISSNSFSKLNSLLYGFFDDFAHRARIVDQRFLFEIADGEARRDDGLAVKVFVDAREDAQQRRLARAIEADDANLRAVEIGKIDVFQDRLSCHRTY